MDPAVSCLHYVKVLTLLKRNALPRVDIQDKSSFRPKVAVEPHVRAIGDGEKWLVDVCDLESDLLACDTHNRHHLTTPLAEVCSVNDLVLNAFAGEPVLQNADSGALCLGHNCDAGSRADGNHNLAPLVGLLDGSDTSLLKWQERVDLLK